MMPQTQPNWQGGGATAGMDPQQIMQMIQQMPPEQLQAWLQTPEAQQMLQQNPELAQMIQQIMAQGAQTQGAQYQPQWSTPQ